MREFGPRVCFLMLYFLFLPALINAQTPPEPPTLTIGSKNFPESYILAEIISNVVERAGEAKVVRKFGMGGTGIVYQALVEEKIDIYPEYTGTIRQVILKNKNLPNQEALEEALREKNLRISGSFGFSNTYALAVRKETADKYKLKKIGDLKGKNDWIAGLSTEFVERKDGYKALAKHYGFPFPKTKRMEHALAYEALRSKKVELIDVYTTDAKLEKFNLALLEDNKAFFPDYLAVMLVRKDFSFFYPKTWHALKSLEGKINEQLMIRLNALVDLEKKSFKEVADIFMGSAEWIRLEQKSPVLDPEKPKNMADAYVKQTRFFWGRIGKLTLEHIFLVFASLVAAVVIGIPLGLMGRRSRLIEHFILSLIGIVQTIPSLALLCFLIPFLGIGTKPALVALFLYALLPIVRNTLVGFKSLDPNYIMTGRSLGLSRFQITRLIEFPLA